MEEFDDSLNSNEAAPGDEFTERQVHMVATNQLIQGLAQSEDLLNTEYKSSVLDLSAEGQIVQGLEISHNRQIELFGPEFGNAQQQNDVSDFFDGSHQDNRQIIQASQGNFAAEHMVAHRRSGPDGSPSFQQSSGFLPSMSNDNESVVFRPRGKLDFSALDETGQTEEILPHGMNRSVSTPEHRGKTISYMERQVCGSHGNDRNSRENSPDTHFYELKNSPLLSETEEELDSRVIFSPLQNLATAQNTSMTFQPSLGNDESLLNTKEDRHVISEQREESEGSASPILSPHQRKPQQTYQRSPNSQWQRAHASAYNISSSHSHPYPHTDTDVTQAFVQDRVGAAIGERREVFVSIPQVNQDMVSVDNVPLSNRSVEMQRASDYRVAPQTNGTTQTSRGSVPRQDMQQPGAPPLSYEGHYSDNWLNARSHSPSNVGNSLSNSTSTKQDKGACNRSLVNSSHSSGVHEGSFGSGSPQTDRQTEVQPNQEIVSSQGSGLPSPSIWQVPEESAKNIKRGNNANTSNVFKEPKATESKRPQNITNKRPTMPARNSQRELVSIQKSRQEQGKKDSQAQQSKVKPQEMRLGNISHGNHVAVKAGHAMQPQNHDTSFDRRDGNLSEKRARSALEKKIPTQKNSTCDRYARTVQGNYSDYERKVEGGAGVGRTRYDPESQRNKSNRRGARETVPAPVRREGIGEDSSPHAHHPGLNVVTQVEHYASDDPKDYRPSHGQNLHDVDSHWPLPADTSIDVQGMEEVRGQLQNMLKISCDAISDNGQYNHNDQVSGLLLDSPQDHYLYQPAIDHTAVSGRNVDDASELYENFPSFSRMWSDTSNVTRSDVSLQTENQRLRDMLEKERYRRKHCEQHIQKMNVKLLETQQQVAVAVSTDKRKDIMIEQLDKQLAKVVEGWKRRDDEKKDYIDQLRKEKSKVEENLVKQRKMIENFEVDMAKAVEELRKEKEEAVITIEKLRTEVDEQKRNGAHLEDQLQAEKEKADIMNQEWETVKETRELGERKIQQLQDRLHKEQDEWFKREQELLQRIEEVTENNMKIVQQERLKCEEQESLLKEIEDKIQSNETEMKRLEMELDASNREKESLKVEMGIMEAKFESAQRSLEAELHSRMQKEIADQMTEVHRKFEEEEEKNREANRKTIREITQRQAKEMEKQLARFHEDLKTREDEHRKICQEYEDKLHESRAEITSLQAIKQKLESQKSETLVKLQYMMQSQWNEAVNMLTATPQRKNMLSTSFTSQIPTETQMFNSSVVNQPASLPVMSSHTTSGSPGKSTRSINNAAVHSSEENKLGYTPSNFVTTYSPKKGDIASEHSLLASVDSPGRESVSADHNPPVSTESTGFNPDVSLADFTSSVQMQQLLQSLSHPDVPVINNIPSSYSGKSDQVTFRPEIHQDYPPIQSVQQNHMTTSGRGKPTEWDNQGVHQLSYHLNDSSHTSELGHRSDLSVQNWLHDSSGPRKPHSQTSDFIGADFGRGHNMSHQNTERPLPVAVAIRPPQQHSSDRQDVSDYSPQKLNNSGHSQHSGGSEAPVYPGKHSPPTKQCRSRVHEDHAVEDDEAIVLDDTTRLTAEYRQISDQLKEHETRQGQLQHYIQMLLHKPPGGGSDDGYMDPENTSLFSHDQTEDLDLNDTAQAAQLQQELTRIQQLREKQAPAVQPQGPVTEQHMGSSAQGNTLPGILNSEQLEEISQYLAQHQDMLKQPQDMEQIADLVDVLKNLQNRQPREQPEQHKSQGRKTEQTHSPRSVPPSVSRDVARVKRNLKSQMASVSQSEGNPGDRSVVTKSQPQPKKVDRKVASVGGAGAGPKPGSGKTKSAWK